MNLDVLKGKTKAHQELANSMEDHCKELEALIEEIKDLQLLNATTV